MPVITHYAGRRLEYGIIKHGEEWVRITDPLKDTSVEIPASVLIDMAKHVEPRLWTPEFIEQMGFPDTPA